MAAIPQPGSSGGMIGSFDLAAAPPGCCSFGPIPKNRWAKYLRFVIASTLNGNGDYAPTASITIKAFGRNLPTDQAAMTTDVGGYIVCRSLTVPLPILDNVLGVGGGPLVFTLPIPPLSSDFTYLVVLIEVGTVRSRGLIFMELEPRGPEGIPIV